MASSALGLGREEEKARKVSLRKSETFRKNMHRLGRPCIDPSTMALYDIFFSLSLSHKRGPIHARKPSPSETKQNIIEHD